MNEREKQFCAELKALLEKYDVELSAREDAGCSDNLRIEAYSPSVMENWEITRKAIDIELGSCVDGESVQFS